LERRPVNARQSAGILPYRRADAGLEVLLGHMGGPFWAKRDAGGWTVIKGEYRDDEDPIAAARREFEEELGLPAPVGALTPLGSARQSGGKVVTVFAAESDIDPDNVTPGTFSMEWPRGSGRIQEFPEIDRVAWFGLPTAREKVLKGQRAFLDRLEDALSAR
jgi:predicted NUDIX family NTP pyrophosphohydrolase